MSAAIEDGDLGCDSLTAQVVGADGALTDSASQALFEQLFPIMYRQMRALSAGRGRELDELVQIAAEQALRSFARFRGECQLATWTYRICYRTLLKHDRTARRWRARFELGSPEQADAHPSAAERLEEAERASRLRAALAQVSAKRRVVVVLHDLEEHSVSDIAEIVGAREGTVRSRLRDGRRQLAKLLVDDPYFGDVSCGAVEP
ncbi:MAG TPA: RNA polymerase sigma factor [Polyangiaceae bacterium]|nr:RNA polymerase sigma factor [Polyangiaceae bacterium]